MEYLLLFYHFYQLPGSLFTWVVEKNYEFQKLDREIENDFIEEFGTYNLRSKKNIQFEKVAEWLENNRKRQNYATNYLKTIECNKT